ncbi:MAG: hypothetical protein ACREPA_05470 [Candidatus Dormibacteraceae bacterium]
MIGALAIALAWLGAALLVLADGGRGLAAGLALAGGGLGVAVGMEAGGAAGLVEGLVVSAGGVLAALPRLADRPPRWAVLRPGSTPRLILSLIVGGAMLWVGGSLLARPSEPQARMAVLIVGGLAGARLISAQEAPGGLVAASALALALGAMAALEGGLPALPAVSLGCLAALVAALLGSRKPPVAA